MIGQQVMFLLGSLTLREWGEQNRMTNQNSISYVLVYGLFSLSSTALAGAAAISLLVFCTLRSTKYLHDSVCRLLWAISFTLTALIYSDVVFHSTGTPQLL